MSENSFSISKINDFIFCPVSIYFHELDIDTDKLTYQTSFQINGTAAHSTVDSGQYSDRKSVLQGVAVYSSKYCLFGKIDIFDIEKCVLTERKKHISKIYDGYIFQLYAQYFALKEAGYNVKVLRLYSYDNNKSYQIALPEENEGMFKRFETTIKNINDFTFDSFKQTNVSKCENCIYEPLCSFSLLGY